MALRCLIVDANAHFLPAARNLLEREGIVVVDVASTGTEALRRTAQLELDLGRSSRTRSGLIPPSGTAT